MVDMNLTSEWLFDYESWDESTSTLVWVPSPPKASKPKPQDDQEDEDEDEGEEPEDEDYEDEDGDEDGSHPDEDEDYEYSDDDVEPEEDDESLEGTGEIEAEVQEGLDEDEGEELEPEELPEGKVVIGEGTHTKEGNRWVQRFENTSEFFNFVYSETDEVYSGGRRKKDRISLQPSYGDRTLGESLESSRKLADYGWPEGVEKILKFTSRLNKVLEASNPLPEVRWDVTGLEFDVGKWLQGEPEQWMYFVDSAVSYDAKPPRLVKIVATIDITMGPEQFIMRGAAVCALAHMLQLHGVSVQIDAHCGSNNIIDTWVRVKDAAWPMNIEQLVFILAHPVVFHKLVMSSWEHLPAEAITAARNLGYGSWGYISEPHKEDRGDIYISAIGSRWLHSEAECLKWITGELDNFGVHIELEEGIKS